MKIIRSLLKYWEAYSDGRFWEVFSEYVKEKRREEYMRKFQHDRRCERCDTWTSEVGGCDEIKYDFDRGLQYMTCSKCKHVSVWRDYGGLAVELIPHEEFYGEADWKK